MSVTGSQRQTFLRLAAALRTHWRGEPGFPRQVQQLLARERSFGSRDRRLYRELLYTVSRYLPWIEPLLQNDPERAADVTAWLAAEIPATITYRAALGSAWPPCPDTVEGKAAHLQCSVAALLPDWVQAECPAVLADGEIDALHRRAPLWLRLQTDQPETVAAEFAQHGWTCRASGPLPTAWEMLTEADVTKTTAYAEGRFEIQDLGSQLILESAGLSAAGHWLDACAGAGGKTLQLARLLGPDARVDAHDIRPAALAELGRRAERAGLGQLRILTKPPTSSYDGVLVDAPCSGSGTWRRSPHLKWSTSPATLARQAARQRTLLGQYARLVRPGGQLIYATCSLARAENTGVVEQFLAENPDFVVQEPAARFGCVWDGTGLLILPAQHDTDGFYVARLHRR